MAKAYYRVFDTQRGVYFATGYNAHGMKDLLRQFRSYIGGAMDAPSRVSALNSWIKVADWLQGSVLEKDTKPFKEEY
jgi:hypothetical protein